MRCDVRWKENKLVFQIVLFFWGHLKQFPGFQRLSGFRFFQVFRFFTIFRDFKSVQTFAGNIFVSVVSFAANFEKKSTSKYLR